MSDASVYPFGYTEEEARRLEWQAVLLEDISRDMFIRAGLGRGMRVLDLGCGVGDVSFLAARLVGREGGVVGVDRSASSLAAARKRARAGGFDNVAFLEGDVTAFDPNEGFDAVIGRFILLYLKDPAGVLLRLKRCVRPGGIVAFQETDYSVVAQAPSSELFERVLKWILGALAAGAEDPNIGVKLSETFLRAGLPRPDIVAGAPAEGGPVSPYYEFITQMIRSMLPLIEKAGIATADEIDVATLTDRLRNDAVAGERLLFPPRVVSAWSRLPAA